MESRRKFVKKAIIGGAALAAVPLILSNFGGEENHSNINMDKFLQACSNGNISKVKELLENNKNLLSVKDNIGRTGFVLALLAGHKNLGEFLKKSGYQVDLHESALSLDWESYDSLLGEESELTKDVINTYHPMGGNVMWAAATGGAGKDMWRIYAKCGNPNLSFKNENGTTPIQKALRYSNLAVAELTAAALLSNNTNPNPAKNADLPPLHIAAKRGSYEMVEMLIRLGADVDRKDINGDLAIKLAEREGHKSVFDLIATHNEIPRTVHTSRLAYDRDGNTYKKPNINEIPLYLRRRLVGMSHGNFDYVKKTVQADARMAHSVATTSEICVEACAHIGNKKIVEFLIENGAPYSLPTAVMLNDFTTVKRLLDEDPNRIYERGAHDFALLWYPIIGRSGTDMTELLINRGAKVEEQHFLGTTALHWASQREQFDQVELLVANGADVNRIGRKFESEGETPLQSTKNDEIRKFLISKGAK
ncbi:ankyrin repeat domain-containing protein [Maribacter halichondriae]|uniref:ankyrin repeat domain-containing protein n=1 Tax=Maribacter halichondriae TaxID=2980554 RepID=UPI0023583590|nr:ankyrin repeat domain-containing protein [Maribacter sp. Hal144]